MSVVVFQSPPAKNQKDEVDAPSATKRSPTGRAQGKRSWLAEKVSKVAKTGNRDSDAAAESTRSMLQDIIDACLDDSANVNAAFAAIQQRRASAVAGLMCDADARFEKITQVDKLPTTWIMNWLTANTDFTMSDLVKISKNDPDGAAHMFVRLLEYPPAMKLPKACYVKVVMFNLATDRLRETHANAIGKASGWMLANGTLDWKAHGAYQLHFAEDRCSHITHNTTKLQIAVPAHIHITRQFVLRQNFSDHLAFVECSPLPPLKLVRLFEDAGCKSEGKGPFSYTVLTGGNCKVFNCAAATAYEAWQAEDKKGSNNAETQQYTDYKKEVAKARLAQARAKLCDNLQERKKHRTIMLEA